MMLDKSLGGAAILTMASLAPDLINRLRKVRAPIVIGSKGEIFMCMANPTVIFQCPIAPAIPTRPESALLLYWLASICASAPSMPYFPISPGDKAMSASTMFYRYLLNPVMRGLLRSPLHGVASDNIAIAFQGTPERSLAGNPLSYMREGDTVRLLFQHQYPLVA